MNDVRFFIEDLDFSLNNKEHLIKWIKSVIKAEGFSLNDLNYIFCSDAYLLKINQSYLNHDTYTDIITFDNSSEETSIESDIYISLDRITENAKDYGVSFEHELQRVMIHGVLHLMGWVDKTHEDKQEMRQKEDACISLLNTNN